MSENSLKIVITKSDLDIVTSRASLAAMTDEAQSEMARASNETIGCIKIVASGNQITFESASSRLGSKYIVNVGDGSEAAIKSEGSVCIPARELKQFASKIPSKHMVSIAFSPKTSDKTGDEVRSVFPNGVVEVTGLDGKKTGAKIKLDSYSASHFVSMSYPSKEDIKVLLSGKAVAFKKSHSLIGFSINTSDSKEKYNKLALFTSPTAVYFLGSDGRRCALVSKNQADFDCFFSEEMEAPVLIEDVFLSPVLSSLSDDDPLVVGINKDETCVYLISGQMSYGIKMVNKALRAEYPSYKKLTELNCKVSVLADRAGLIFSVETLGVANKERGKYVFSDKSKTIQATSRGYGVIKEANGESSCEFCGEFRLTSEAVFINTQDFLEGLKKMKSENIRITFTENERKIKIEDEKDPQFVYYMQAMTAE